MIRYRIPSLTHSLRLVMIVIFVVCSCTAIEGSLSARASRTLPKFSLSMKLYSKSFSLSPTHSPTGSLSHRLTTCSGSYPQSQSPIAILSRLRGGNGNSLKVHVKTFAGKTVTVEVDPEESIESLKTKIQSQEGIPPNQQRILFGGKQLDSKKKISDYDIENESTMHMVLRLRGGRQNKMTAL